jgi:hypothetical protein
MVDSLIQGNLDSPLSDVLTIAHHSAELSFNGPEKVGTNINLSIYPGGDKCYKMHSDLKAKY